MLLAASLVLAGYLLTLAPTVTFWDAGEFITAAREFGVPHPPGTPLFVIVAGVWSHLLPIGAFAWRVNLLSAVCGAAAGACWFAVAHDIVVRLNADVPAPTRRSFANVAALAAALLASFAFSTWQNSTEAEVYSGATLLIALAMFLAIRWRCAHDPVRRGRLALAILLCGALASGEHPMGLLVGPAAGVMLLLGRRRNPGDRLTANVDVARAAVVAAAWLLLIGVAQADTVLVPVAAILLVGAAVWCGALREKTFVAIALLIVVAGASLQLFLLVRAGQHPILDQADPSTWHALLDVLRRRMYPPRTPFDNPNFAHGPGNPGRTWTLLFYQAANYVQYFDWQWAASFGDLSLPSLPRLGVTLVMAWIGIRGLFAHRHGDRVSFVMLATLFVCTGPLLMLDLNFKPGPSIGWNIWKTLGAHEVRDRDYFYVASFTVWSVWVALGLAGLVRAAVSRTSARWRAVAPLLFAIALVPFVLNYRAADRRHGADATFAEDYAHALLDSAPDHAILFTAGDNDTFPVWYAQQVEQFRPDVSVVALSLSPAAWYVRSLRKRDASLTTLDDGVYPDQLVADIVAHNRGTRPIAWSTTAGDDLGVFRAGVVQEGLTYVLPVVPVDPADLATGAAESADSIPLDVAVTRRLAADWHYGNLARLGDADLDGNLRALADFVAEPMRQLGAALEAAGDSRDAKQWKTYAMRIAQ